MLDLNKHEITKKINYSEDEWYEIVYCPLDKINKFKDDRELFMHILKDWGGVKAGAKELSCTNENKKKFYDVAADRVAFIIQRCADKYVFGPNGEAYLRRLGELQDTSGHTNGHSRTRSTQTAESV